MFTAAQNAAIKAYIVADQTLNSQPSDGDGLQVIADALNAIASPAFLVWQTSVSADAIFNAVDRGKYTPTDAASDSLLYTNRILAAQTKMMSLDGMLTGRVPIDASKTTIRASLKDAVIQLPTGLNGAMTTAGGANGVNVLNVCTRPARVIEKILAASIETTPPVTASIMGFEGTITPTEVDTARRS